MTVFGALSPPRGVLSQTGSTFDTVAWDPWAGAEAANVDVGWSELGIRVCYFPEVRVFALGNQLLEWEARGGLTHELAHHVLDHRPHARNDDRQEERAQRWAAIRLLDLEDLKSAMRGATSLTEVAEDLQVDPELLEVRLRWLDDNERRELGL